MLFLKGNHIPEPLQEILKRQQQQKVTSGTIAPATVAIQHIKVTKPSVLTAFHSVHCCHCLCEWTSTL